MAKPALPVIKIPKIEQVCMVVHDIDKTMEAMWNKLGIGPWGINIRSADSMSDMIYYGKPARFGWKAARAPNKLGGMEIELIEPTEGDSVYSDLLRKHGECAQHFGWYLVPTLEGMAETIEQFERAGFPCMMSGRCSASAFAFINTIDVLQITLELLWWDPSADSKPPMHVYPKDTDISSSSGGGLSRTAR